MSGKPNKSRCSAPEVRAKSYRAEFLRRRTIQKTLKGNQQGSISLPKLAETIHNGMEVLWRQNMMCDVKLVISDRSTFHAHRLILATSSDFFYDVFVETEGVCDPEGYRRETENTVYIPDVKKEVFEIILESLYTGKITVDSSNVDEVLAAASFLGIFSVLEACEAFLMDHIQQDNCLELLDTASRYNLTRLTDASVGKASKNFQTICKKPIFKTLQVERLIPMLLRDDLEVSGELEVFKRVCSWIEEDKHSRMHHAAALMATVRLPLLDPATVVDNVESCSYLMAIPQCQELVKEALHYHCMPARQCLLQSPRTVPRLASENCIVIIGGSPWLKTDVINDDILKYNASQNRWDHVTKLPQPRHHHAVAVLNGFMYVAGGQQSHDQLSTVKTVYRYDPRNSSWTTVASMNTGRHSFPLVVHNGCLYAVGGGINKDDSLASVERYNPSLDKWEELAPLSSPKRAMAAAVLGGKLYAVGGSGNKVISSRVEKYFPIGNRWELLKACNVPRIFGHLARGAGDHLYLVGGATLDSKMAVICVDIVERFSQVTNQWTIVTRLRSPRSECGFTIMQDKLCLIGGYNWNTSERCMDAETYDTEANSWSDLHSIPKPLLGLAAACLTLYENRPTAAKLSQ